MYKCICTLFVNVQTRTSYQLADRKSAAASSLPEPVSNISLPPEIMLSSTETSGQHASDAAVQPVSNEATVDESVMPQQQPAATTVMSSQDALSSPSQLRSSKRSTQRPTKPRSSSVSHFYS